MTIKAVLGNGLISFGGYVGAKTLAITSASTAPLSSQLMQTYNLVGFEVPRAVGVVLYFLFLVIGAAFSVNQPTPVDHKFKYPWLKPVYSLAFGMGVTLFIAPHVFPDVTIWHLIIPGLFCAAIGAVVIYYVIDFFTSAKLWDGITTWAHGSVSVALSRVGDRIRAAWDGFKNGGGK